MPPPTLNSEEPFYVRIFWEFEPELPWGWGCHSIVSQCTQVKSGRMWRSMVRKGRNCTIKIVVVGFEVLDSIYLTVHYLRAPE